jgi:WD40 repeat protein
MSKFSFPDEV